MTGGVEGAEHGELEGFFLFYFYFLYHVFVVKYKKQHGALAMAETKL